MKRTHTYVLDYRDNETRAYMSYEFEASSDAEAQLIAEAFCDQGWHNTPR